MGGTGEKPAPTRLDKLFHIQITRYFLNIILRSLLLPMRLSRSIAATNLRSMLILFIVNNVNENLFGIPIKIIGGEFIGEFGLSNYWYWKRVNFDRTFSKRIYGGYGGCEPYFVKIDRRKGVRLAEKLLVKS